MFLDAAKVNNSKENKSDKAYYFTVQNIISQFVEVAKVNSITYNNAKTSDKTWFLGV